MERVEQRKAGKGRGCGSNKGKEKLCRRQIPSRYRPDSSGSEENDDTLCSISHNNEPEGLASGVVFWVDCNDCGNWIHNVCAFRLNVNIYVRIGPLMLLCIVYVS